MTLVLYGNLDRQTLSARATQVRQLELTKEPCNFPFCEESCTVSEIHGGWPEQVWLMKNRHAVLCYKMTFHG